MRLRDSDNFLASYPQFTGQTWKTFVLDIKCPHWAGVGLETDIYGGDPDPPHPSCPFYCAYFCNDKMNDRKTSARGLRTTVGSYLKIPSDLRYFECCTPPELALVSWQISGFWRYILRILHISKMPKSQKISTWSPWVKGSQKIKNFEIDQNLFILFKTNIESHVGGYHCSPRYRTNLLSRSDAENAISRVPR